MRYFDLHCDTIGECALRGCGLRKNCLNVDLTRAPRVWAQAFACWIPDTLRGAQAKSRFDLVYRKFLEQMALNAGCCAFCRGSGEMTRALACGRAACFFTLEGSAALAGDLDALYEVYQKGVRMITLTWNGECEAGAGCHAKGGLTAFGRALVGEMARLRVIIDVSHLSDQGFDDVAACTDVPFIASHSNARAVCGSARNLTDAQFCEIVRRGGLAGLNFYPEFINSRKKTVYEDILYHVEHFLELGGEDALAIGADFDGAVVPTGAAASGYQALPYNLHGIEDMETVYNFLLGYYPEPVVDKIFFANACRFFKRYLTE